MGRVESAILIFALSLTAGILPLRGQESVDPRGPYPDHGLGNVDAFRTGDLKVLLEANDLRGGCRQVQDARRPRCRIYDDGGHFVREVVQQSVTGGAVTMELPPGRYLVEVVAPYRAKSPFWVTVKENQSTIVDPSKEGQRQTLPPPVEP
jgi:hypothetical protein